MGLLDNILSAIDNKKRTFKRGVMDMIDNPGDWSNMTASRMRENIYGGPENWDAMKKYLQQQPYDKKLKDAAQQSMINNAVNESLGAVTAWHGSPYKFDKFDMSKIGTGEGAQAYGHGLYMAETPEVAGSYAASLGSNPVKIDGQMISDVIQDPLTQRFIKEANGDLALAKERAQREWMHFKKVEPSATKRGYVEDAIKQLDSLSGKNIEGSGQLYKVDIPDEAVSRFLDWDKPLSEELRKPVSDAAMKKWESGLSGTSGEHLYKEVVKNFEWAGSKSPKDDAINWLNQQGVPGIRYLDGGSRGRLPNIPVSDARKAEITNRLIQIQKVDLPAAKDSGTYSALSKEQDLLSSELQHGNMPPQTSNYVLFDDQLPRILERNGEPTGLQPWAKGEWKGLLDDAPAPKLTEFEQRHLTAQKNAALPVEHGGLGLPPNNTAMDRAEILFPESGFHATGADIKSIDPSKVAESDYGTIGQGFYIDPREGAGYSNLVAKINANKAPQNIMPLRYSADNLYDVTDLVGVRDAASSAKLTSNLKDAGYSGTVSMTMDGLPNEVAIFDPSKVRSRFAAFDPMRRHEADLLGYADPYLLGAMGAGGLLGMGGYSMMNDK